MIKSKYVRSTTTAFVDYNLTRVDLVLSGHFRQPNVMGL